jgi:nucleotide-binding universal stress UspA family protein
MERIVIAFDGSEPATRALARATSIAKAFDSSLIVISVAPITVGLHAAPVDTVDSPEVHTAELDQARTHIEEQELTAEYVVGSGDPADAIVELAHERDADLIVVGTREVGVVGRLLGQSVSGTVAHHAHRDVLIVH